MTLQRQDCSIVKGGHLPHLILIPLCQLPSIKRLRAPDWRDAGFHVTLSLPAYGADSVRLIVLGQESRNSIF